jgi:hypothetical protein
MSLVWLDLCSGLGVKTVICWLFGHRPDYAIGLHQENGLEFVCQAHAVYCQRCGLISRNGFISGRAQIDVVLHRHNHQHKYSSTDASIPSS